MPRFDLLDEFSCVIVPGRPRNAANVGITHREIGLDGPRSESGREPSPTHGQVFSDAVILSVACLCWISW
jgi:hypothetical protein